MTDPVLYWQGRSFLYQISSAAWFHDASTQYKQGPHQTFHVATTDNGFLLNQKKRSEANQTESIQVARVSTNLQRYIFE